MNRYYEGIEYAKLTQELSQQELFFLFGDNYEFFVPRTIIEKFGEPIEKRQWEFWHDVDRIGTWRFAQGFEIDIGTQNDFPILVGYVYFSPECELILSSGIRIGSSFDEVHEAYGELINPLMTTDSRIAIGQSIYFLTNNDIVQSIYINTWDHDYNRFFIPGEQT